MEKKLIYQIALSKIPGVGAKLGKQLIAYCGGVEAVFSERKRLLRRVPGIGEHLASQIARTDPYSIAEKDLSYYKTQDIKVTFCLDKDYPIRLRHFDDAPLIIYSKGNYCPNPKRTVAIVGTRIPSPYGQLMCKTLVQDLAPFDAQIISGLAYGIDALAHKCANQLAIENIAIMGTGMDVIYPAAHRHLAGEIENNGSLISEYPINMRADKENFPRRNRIIAAMADAIVVIQSGKKGGSLITAEYANQYFKDVFAFPGRVSDKASQGCNALIKQNKAHLIESVADIAYIMRWSLDNPEVTDKQTSLFIELNPHEQKILDLIKAREEATIDWLHYNSKKSLSELSNILLSLEFKGIVLSLPGKKYCLT